jgi:hypothetical protein
MPLFPVLSTDRASESGLQTHGCIPPCNNRQSKSGLSNMPGNSTFPNLQTTPSALLLIQNKMSIFEFG